MIIFLFYCSDIFKRSFFPYPWGFIVVIDCVHVADVVSAGDVVDIADVVGTWDVVGMASRGGGGPVAGMVALQKPQGEQAEVGLVAQVEEAPVGAQVVGVGGSLFVGRRLLIAVNAAAQQLLVL